VVSWSVVAGWTAMKSILSAPAFRLSILAACAALVGGTVAANASTYLATVEQVGPNVVATGSGSVDLTGLISQGLFFGVTAVSGSVGYLSLGNGGFTSGFSGLSGPASFGLGSTVNVSATSGPFTAISGSGFGTPFIFVPQGYVSNTALGPSTSTFAAATLASLGLIPGTYIWTWGAAAAPTLDGPALNSFTLQIVAPTVPLPAALPLFATGLGVLGLLGWRRKRKASA